MRAHGLLGLLALVAIAGLILAHAEGGYVWDESSWVANARLIETRGFGPEFLRQMERQAPGPLWQAVHLLAEPLTGLRPARMRLLNLALAVGVLVLLGRILSGAGAALHPRSAALAVLSVPGFAAVSGTAMTEIPALLFALGFVERTLRWIPAAGEPAWRRAATACAAGLLLGVAALGRVDFAVLALAPLGVLLLPALRAQWRPIALGSALCAAAAAAVCAPLLWIWGGLVPPALAAELRPAANPWNAILVSIQLGGVLFVLWPHWFRPSRREAALFGALGLAALLANGLGLHYEHASSTVERLLGGAGLASPAALSAASRAVPALYVTWCGYFSWCAIRFARRHLDGIVPLLGALIAALLVAGALVQPLAFKIRYTASIAPFLVLLLGPRVVGGRLSLAAKAGGLVLGLLLLRQHLASG